MNAPPPTRTTVLHVVWRLTRGGGVPVVVRAVATGLDADRYDVHIATVRPLISADELDRLPPTVSVHPLGLAGPATATQRLRVALSLARLARRLRPGVLHVHSGIGSYAALAGLSQSGTTRVLEVHDAPGNGRHGRATEWVEAQMCRRLGFLPLVHSGSVRAETAAAYRLPVAAVEVIPLGIETAHFGAPTLPAGAWRAANGVPAAATLVLYVARFVPSKNVSLLVDVARLVCSHAEASDVVFVVLGSGPPQDELEARIKGLGLERAVRLLVGRYRPDLVDAYHACDLFLSTSSYEGFGLAVAEAMAAGKPVVATAVGGVADLVEHGTSGLLAPPGDAAALAVAVRELATDPERRAAMGRAGQERARRRFDVATMVAGYDDLYQRLAGARPVARPAVDVMVLKSPDFTGWRRDQGPDAGLPYRIDHLAAAGIGLHWSDAAHRFPWSSRPARTALARAGRLGPPFLQTALSLPRIARYPATLAMFESEGSFLAWLRRLGVPGLRRRRLVVISCWLAQLLPGMDARRQAWYRQTYRHVDRLLFFSSNQAAVYRRHLGLGADALAFVPFGVDHELFVPSAADDGFVLVVGRDRGRDWPTCFAAMAAAGLPTKVLCRPRDVEGLAIPANVDILGYAPRTTYRQMLARARVVVVPSHPLAYPSGQSVLLEAMATAKCVVATATPAMSEYLDAGVSALAVPVGDAAALAAATAAAFGDAGLRHCLGAGGRQAVEQRFNARMMWEEIADHIRDLVA